MDILAKVPQVFLLLIQPENNTGLLVWLLLLVATTIAIMKIRSRWVKPSVPHYQKKQHKKRGYKIGCVYAWISFASLIGLFAVIFVSTSFEANDVITHVASRYTDGETSTLTCAPFYQCDIFLINNKETTVLRSVNLSENELKKYSSATRGFPATLNFGNNEIGLFRQTIKEEKELVIYLSWSRLIDQILARFFPWAGFLSIILMVLYFGLIRKISKELVRTAEALGEGHIADQQPAPSQFVEISAIQNALFNSEPAESLTSVGQVTLGDLNLLTYSFEDLNNLRSELFEPLRSLAATSLRIIQPTQERPEADQVFDVICSREDMDPFGKFDPVIFTLSGKTGEMFLENTRQLFKKSNNFDQSIPRSLFFIALRKGEQLVGVLWGAFQEERVFSTDDIEAIKSFASQLTQGEQNKTARNITSEIEIQKLNAIIRSTPDPLILLDANFNLKYANKNASILFGTKLEKGVGSPIDALLDAPALVNLLRSTITNETNNEITLINGNTYSALSKSINVLNLHNARLWIFRDITSFKEQERLKTEFVNTVSHDLRGPLSLIRGYANMIEMVGTLNDQQVVYSQKINESIEDMSKLINSLLDLGRIDAGVSMQLELVSVKELLDKVCGPIQVLAIQKKILFEKEFIGNDVLAQLDPGLVQQAVTNLLENAIKYSNEGSKVELKVISGDGQLKLSVQDNGLGIAKVDQPHLFEKFYRGKKAEIKTRKGSGLGLAIVKSIIEHHHGTVWFDSKEGIGSTFYITLPIRQQTIDKNSF
jgi:signal transduction histidine kinase